MNRWIVIAIAAVVVLGALAGVGAYFLVRPPVEATHVDERTQLQELLAQGALTPEQAIRLAQLLESDTRGDTAALPATSAPALTPEQSAPLWLARANVSAQRYDEAITRYRSAIELISEPQRKARVHAELASIYIATSAPDLAITSYEAAVALDASNTFAKLGLASLYMTNGRLEASRALLTPILADESLRAPERAMAAGFLADLAVIELAQAAGPTAIRFADRAYELDQSPARREAACLTRLRFRQLERAAQFCTSPTPQTVPGLTIEGMYQLTLANNMGAGGDQRRTWNLAARSFTEARRLAGEARSEWSDRATYGRRYAEYCAGLMSAELPRPSQEVDEYFGRYVLGCSPGGSASEAGGDPAFLASLVAEDRSTLRRADFEEVAARLGCEWEAVAAVAEVESGRFGGFAQDGRPIILFERHMFSRRTNSIYDQSHPTISNRTAGGYPRTQVERWRQVADAYALNAEAALSSTSFGRFGLLGSNFANMGYTTAREYVAFMARSERNQLVAFEAFIRSSGLADELQRKDWAGFAARYHGPAYAENQYDTKMAQAYARLKATPPA